MAPMSREESHCPTCEKDLTALDLLVAVEEVHVVLREPTEQDCRAFEDTLGSITYVSDASEDGDVTYTLWGASEEMIKQRIAQAKVAAEVLDW